MMKKRMIILLSVASLTMSCGPTLVNSFIKINTGEAKRFAKVVLEEKDRDLSQFNTSTELSQYISSDEGEDYYNSILEKYGDIKKIKIKGIKGNTEDTMNYRFMTTFKDSEEIKEIRVQSYLDKEFVNLQIGPWKDIMKPLNK